MEILESTFAGNALRQWLIAAAASFAFVVFVGLFKGFVQKRLAPLAGHRAGPQWEALVRAIAARTQFILVIIVGVRIGAEFVALPKGTVTFVSRAAALAVLIQTGIWAVAFVNFWIDRKTARIAEVNPENVTTLRGLGIVVKLTLWIVFTLMALDNLGFDVTALVTGLGIGGIAVALAVQNILGDLFASLTIVLDKPFVVGDFIIVGDLMGTVKSIGLKTTRIQSLSGEELVFSNSDLLQSRVRNFKKLVERRAVFTFGVTYQTTPEKLRRIPDIVRELIAREPQARVDRVHFKLYGPSSLDFEAVYFVLDSQMLTYMDIQERINLALFDRFAEEGIEFAYPTQTLHIGSMPPRPSAPSNPIPV